MLNTCHAFALRDEGVICSKDDGGAWALRQRLQPEFVERALDAQRRGSRHRVGEEAAAWVRSVAKSLSDE